MIGLSIYYNFYNNLLLTSKNKLARKALTKNNHISIKNSF